MPRRRRFGERTACITAALVSWRSCIDIPNMSLHSIYSVYVEERTPYLPASYRRNSVSPQLASDDMSKQRTPPTLLLASGAKRKLRYIKSRAQRPPVLGHDSDLAVERGACQTMVRVARVAMAISDRATANWRARRCTAGSAPILCREPKLSLASSGTSSRSSSGTRPAIDERQITATVDIRSPNLADCTSLVQPSRVADEVVLLLAAVEELECERRGTVRVALLGCTEVSGGRIHLSETL